MSGKMGKEVKTVSNSFEANANKRRICILLHYFRALAEWTSTAGNPEQRTESFTKVERYAVGYCFCPETFSVVVSSMLPSQGFQFPSASPLPTSLGLARLMSSFLQTIIMTVRFVIVNKLIEYQQHNHHNEQPNEHTAVKFFADPATI